MNGDEAWALPADWCGHGDSIRQRDRTISELRGALASLAVQTLPQLCWCHGRPCTSEACAARRKLLETP